jgi:AraC-like DNA-binding protein
MQDSGSLRARISTRDFPEGKRLDMWREVYGRGITNVDIAPIGDAPFHAEVTFNLLPNVAIAAGSRSPASYRVSKEMAARGKNIVVISLLRSGSATATQFDRELICGVGSASVLAPHAPSSSTMLTQGNFITLALAQPAIATLAPHYSDTFGKTIASGNAALYLLTRYVDIVRSDDTPLDPALMRSASDHILDLAALALGASGDVAEMARQRSATAARFAVIKADVLHALGRGDLSTEMIALRHGISPRYVRKLFEQSGSSFSAFVLIERLAKAQRMLVDRRCGHLNIAQIAHESGFNDVSYFNRVFRRHFGATPTDLREAARPSWGE